MFRNDKLIYKIDIIQFCFFKNQYKSILVALAALKKVPTN